jgi:hypothetical protein
VLTEDLSLFFNTADFAVTAIYNGSTSVNGIMGRASVAVNEVESTAPSFTCAAVDVPNAKHGDTVVLNEINYKVVGVLVDGTGILTLVLEEQ